MRNFLWKKISVLIVGIVCITPLVNAETKLPISHGPINGTLFLHGGGKINHMEFLKLINDTNGDDIINIVVISTALGPRRKSDLKFKNGLPIITHWKSIDSSVIAIEMYVTSSKQAESISSVSLINNADAIWMTGGNQSYLTEVFNDTASLNAMNILLNRGGVIGGSSAGAQVQSSFMTRGDFSQKRIMGDGQHQDGFGFLKNVALDVHVAQRRRVGDLSKLYILPRSKYRNQKINPIDILGVGIDEGTAVVFMGGVFEVRGKGNVHIYDAKKWNDVTGPSYMKLMDGEAYNLSAREKL